MEQWIVWCHGAPVNLEHILAVDLEEVIFLERPFGLDLVLITCLLLWRPYPTSLVPFFWVTILWSMSDAIFQTQLYTVYGVEFNTSTDAAFSNFRVWEALGFAIAYGYQSFLTTR